MKLSRTVSKYRVDTISTLKITKGGGGGGGEGNSAKKVDGVTVLKVCTSSCHTLSFYQVL